MPLKTGRSSQVRLPRWWRIPTCYILTWIYLNVFRSWYISQYSPYSYTHHSQYSPSQCLDLNIVGYRWKSLSDWVYHFKISLLHVPLSGLSAVLTEIFYSYHFILPLPTKIYVHKHRLFKTLFFMLPSQCVYV